MKFAIRDDDTSYFTQPEQLEQVYHDVWDRVPIGLAVVPHAAGFADKAIPDKYWDAGRAVPLEENPAIVQALRDQDLFKVPGVAETIDWATALTELDARSLTPQVVGDTLGALLKYQDDIGRMQGDALTKVIKEAVNDPSN